MTVKLIQRIWQEGRVPAAMKQANIILLPKTTPPSMNPAEHRPISLLNMWYKVLDNIIKSRLQEDFKAHDVLSEEQAGFRSGKSCQDQVFILETIADR